MEKALSSVKEKQVEKEKDTTWKRLIRLCILFAFLNYFFSLSIVPSESMSPIIEPKDFILYNKKSKDFERGDIIGFVDPFGEDIFVKRIIALGGEKIEIKNGNVYINDEKLEEPYLKEEMYGDMDPVIVPDGEFFVMGDNRNHSADSRIFGTIKESDIKGKFIAILLPFNRFMIHKH